MRAHRRKWPCSWRFRGPLYALPEVAADHTGGAAARRAGHFESGPGVSVRGPIRAGCPSGQPWPTAGFYAGFVSSHERLEPTPQRIVMSKQPVDLAVEHLQIGQIHQPDGAPADLVFVGRADAAAGGADRALARGLLARDVELLMQRQDQRRVLGDAQNSPA